MDTVKKCPKKDNLQGLSIEIKQNDRLSQNGLQQNNKLTKTQTFTQKTKLEITHKLESI